MEERNRETFESTLNLNFLAFYLEFGDHVIVLSVGPPNYQIRESAK